MLAYWVLRQASAVLSRLGWRLEHVCFQASGACSRAIVHRLGRCPECGKRLIHRGAVWECPDGGCLYNMPW